MTRTDIDPSESVTTGTGEDPMELARRRRSRSTGRLLWLLAAAFLVFCALQLDIVPERLLDATDRARFVIDVMLPPAMGDPATLWGAALESIQIAVVGTAFGILLSLLCGILAAKNVSPIGPLSWAIKGLAGLVRSVPALVWALLFIVAVGLGPTAGILAIAVKSVGMLAKVYAETIEEIPMGPIEALRASGASRLQVALQGVLPSVAGVFIAWSVFRFDINVRYASVLGVVGAGGIGWELVRVSQQGRYDMAIGVTVVIFAMVMASELISEWLQRRSDNAALKATS